MDLHVVAPAPGRHEASMAAAKRELLEAVGAEVDHLVAERPDVAGRVSSRASASNSRARPSGRVRSSSPPERRQDHVEPDQVLHRAVVDRLRHAPAHLAPPRASCGGRGRVRAAARPSRRCADGPPPGPVEIAASANSVSWNATTWESSDEPPRITEPATSTTTQMTASATPRRSPWKWAWAATRKVAAERTPREASGVDELDGERAPSRSPPMTSGPSALSGSRAGRAEHGQRPGHHEAADHERGVLPARRSA